MKIKNNLAAKVFTPLFLMLTILSFSDCKKSNNDDGWNTPEMTSDSMQMSAPTTKMTMATSAVAAPVVTGNLNVSSATSDGGFAYIIKQDLKTLGDSPEQPTISTLKIFENGIELNPPHSVHQDIRNLGKGRFSHWYTRLVFSTSDNSNPSTNGRKYTFSTGATVPVPAAPTITSFTPASAASGATVTITGTNFTGATAVSFGGTAATSYSVVSSTSITTKVGTGASGNISVTTPNGTITRAGFTFTQAPIPPAPSTTLIGYATVNGMTTGGQGGQTVTVSTLSALKSALSSTSPLIIKVSGTITGTGLLYVESNKTILGLSGSRLQGAALMIYGKSNIIVRNMTISKVVTYSNIIIKESSHHVWIDHCELYSEIVSSWEYYDGLLDVGSNSDFITLSWNKLHDSHIAMLIGFSYTRTSDKDFLHVTVHHNYFYNVTERGPKVDFGTVHVFNNYTVSGGYIGSLMGATVRVENSYFKNTTLPIRTEISPVAGFISGLSTNTFDNCGKNIITTAASNWVPTYEYKSQLDATADVPALVTKGAGATLTF